MMSRDFIMLLPFVHVYFLFPFEIFMINDYAILMLVLCVCCVSVRLVHIYNYIGLSFLRHETR